MVKRKATEEAVKMAERTGSTMKTQMDVWWE
jgi:hypothetical protein